MILLILTLLLSIVQRRARSDFLPFRRVSTDDGESTTGKNGQLCTNSSVAVAVEIVVLASRSGLA